MMSVGEFEGNHEVSAVKYHDQLIFQRAVREGESFTGSIWDYTPWGSIHEYHFVDGKPTELTTYAYYVDDEDGIINHYVLAQTGNNDFQESIVDGFQNGLDAIGLIPVVGEIFDGANGLIYLARGDKLSAGLSFAAMVPVLGWGATGTKLATRAHTVYKGIKNGKEYVGITVNLGKRYTAAERAAMDIRELYTNVPGRDLARAIEQTLINEKGLGNLANEINSISPANQLGKYSDIMNAAKSYMGAH